MGALGRSSDPWQGGLAGWTRALMSSMESNAERSWMT
jgi:hypothetical protein